MDDRQRTLMKRLLDRLLATRARRDREERLSAPWKAADTELHEIEKAIFRVPLEEQAPTGFRRPTPTGADRFSPPPAPSNDRPPATHRGPQRRLTTWRTVRE